MGDSKEPYPGGSRWVCHRCVIGVKFSYGSLEPIVGLGHDFTLLLWLGLDITREGLCFCCSDFGFPWYHIVKKHIFSICHKMSLITRDSLLVQNEGNLHPNLPFNHLLRHATWSKFKTLHLRNAVRILRFWTVFTVLRHLPSYICFWPNKIGLSKFPSQFLA